MRKVEAEPAQSLALLASGSSHLLSQYVFNEEIVKTCTFSWVCVVKPSNQPRGSPGGLLTVVLQRKPSKSSHTAAAALSHAGPRALPRATGDLARLPFSFKNVPDPHNFPRGWLEC